MTPSDCKLLNRWAIVFDGKRCRASRQLHTNGRRMASVASNHEIAKFALNRIHQLKGRRIS